MENNNAFKTIIWIVIILVVVAIIAFLVTRGKGKNNTADQNMVIGDAQVDKIDIALLESFPVQVNVLASGTLPDDCTEIGDVVQRYDNGTFYVSLETKRPQDAVCTQVTKPFSKNVSLSGVVGLPKGDYVVDVNGVKGTFAFEVDNFISDTDPLK